MNKRNAQTLNPKHLLALIAASILFFICCWNDSHLIGYTTLQSLRLANIRDLNLALLPPLLTGLFVIFTSGFNMLRQKTGALVFSVLHLILAILTCLRVFSSSSPFPFLLPDLIYVAAAFMSLIYTLSPKNSRTFPRICLLIGIFSMLLTLILTFFQFRVLKNSRFVGLQLWLLWLKSKGLRPMPLFSSYSFILRLEGPFSVFWPLSKGISLITLSMGFVFSSPSPVSHHNKRKAEKSMVDSHYREGTSELYSASLGKLIVLSILTLGIYGLVWQYRLTRSICSMSDERESATTEFLLCILIPFYSLYWYYKRGKSFAEAAQDRGYAAEDRGVLYLLAALFGFGIINMCLMQDDVNRIVNGTMRRHVQQRSTNIHHDQAHQQPYAESVYRQPVYERPRPAQPSSEPEYVQPAYQPSYQRPQPLQTEAIQPSESTPEQAPRRRRRAAVSSEKIEKLQQIQALLDAGTINADEFSQLKAEILSED